MSKFCLSGILVVEGKNDASKLSSIVSSPIIITNGCDLSKRLIKFLQSVEKKNKLLLLFDPDAAGCNIRQSLITNLNNYEIIRTNEPVYVSKKKFGVHEMDINYLKNLLGKYEDKNISKDSKISTSDIYKLSCKINTNVLIEEYSLTRCTNSGIANQLNMLGITFETLCEKYGIE